MALIVAMGPPKKGNKMKKKEEVMLEDDLMSDIASDTDFEDESEYDDLEEEESMDSEDEDMLFGDMDDSGDADLEMLIEDVMSAFEAKDSKQLMNALKDFIRSVMDKE
jgi:hypothetical protein